MAQTPPMIQLAQNPKLGSILVNAQGMTLYTLNSEAGGKFACIGGCTTVWPPLLLPAGTTTPTAAPGITGLGVITRPEGTTQVTFKGLPLYIFSHDMTAGDTNGDGIMAFGGVWHAAKPESMSLAATPAVRLTIKITTTGSTVWGRVTASYKAGHHRVHLTCARASCQFTVPQGLKVYAAQTAKNASTWPFKEWQIHPMNGKAKTVKAGSLAWKLTTSDVLTAVYVVSGGSSTYGKPGY